MGRGGLEEVTYDLTDARAYESHNIFDVDPLGPFSCVESVYFMLGSATMILLNIALAVAKKRMPQYEEQINQAQDTILVFFLLELIFRLMHFKLNFVYGTCSHVVGNLLDASAVLGSAIERWILPHESVNAALVAPVVRCLRVFWIVRMLRQMRHALVEIDLRWISGRRFEVMIAFVIVINAIVMGVETDNDWQGWQIAQQVMLIVFIFELCVRIKENGAAAFFFGQAVMKDKKAKVGEEKSGARELVWNWLDTVIVVFGALDLWFIPVVVMMGEDVGLPITKELLSHMSFFFRMMRLLRIIRLLKLVKAVLPLYSLAMGMLRALQGVFWVMVLTFVTLYAYSILMTHLIGHGLVVTAAASGSDAARELFGNVPASMYQLFKVMNGDLSDLESIMAESGLMRLLVGFFLITAHWGLLATLTAVVSDNVITVTQEQARETEESDNALALERFCVLLLKLDHRGARDISREEMVAWLHDPENLSYLRSMTNMTPGEMLDLWELVQTDGTALMRDFVEAFRLIKGPVSEKAIIRTEARISKLAVYVGDLHQETHEAIAGLGSILSEHTRLLQRLSEQLLEHRGSMHATGLGTTSNLFGEEPQLSRGEWGDSQHKMEKNEDEAPGNNFDAKSSQNSQAFFWMHDRGRALADLGTDALHAGGAATALTQILNPREDELAPSSLMLARRKPVARKTLDPSALRRAVEANNSWKSSERRRQSYRKSTLPKDFIICGVVREADSAKGSNEGSSSDAPPSPSNGKEDRSASASLLPLALDPEADADADEEAERRPPATAWGDSEVESRQAAAGGRGARLDSEDSSPTSPAIVVVSAISPKADDSELTVQLTGETPRSERSSLASVSLPPPPPPSLPNVRPQDGASSHRGGLAPHLPRQG